MKRSNRLILLIGVFLAVVAFVLIVILLGGGRHAAAGPTRHAAADLPTVIAAQDIPLGATLTESDAHDRALAVDAARRPAPSGPSQVIGQIVRRSVTSGGQLTPRDLRGGIRRPADIEVPPGQRAMSLQVDAGQRRRHAHQDRRLRRHGPRLDRRQLPGRRVNPEDDSIQVVAGLNSTSVKLLLEGMQVLGVVRQPPRRAPRSRTPRRSAAPARHADVSEASTALVILSLTAQQAEVIKFAQLQGNISLVLRSPQDFFDENGEPVSPIPAGTTGVILKTLVDGATASSDPELVEAILPAQGPVDRHNQRSRRGRNPAARRARRTSRSRARPALRGTSSSQTKGRRHRPDGRPDPCPHRGRHPGDPRSPDEAARVRERHRGGRRGRVRDAGAPARRRAPARTSS